MRRNHSLRTSVALAAVTALLGACSAGSADTDDKTDERPSSSSPTPTKESSTPTEEIVLPDGVLALPPEASTDSATLDAGRYHVPLSDTLAFEVDLPQDTDANNGGLYLASDNVVLKVEAASPGYGVPSDPCHGVHDIIPTGPYVEALVAAIRSKRIFRVSHPERVELDGARGTRLEVRIPAGYDATSCRDGQVGLPGNPDTSNNTLPGYVGYWWILDVDGQLVVVQQLCAPCESDTLDRRATTVQSITFTPTP